MEAGPSNTENLDVRIFNPPSYTNKLAYNLPKSPIESPFTGDNTPVPKPQTEWRFPPPINKVKGPREKNVRPIVKPGTKEFYHVPNKFALTYELNKFKENRMIIFDHDEFQYGLPRPGTDKDEAALRETFRRFRFTIDDTHRNLKKNALLMEVQKFALETDFRMYGCICVAILTHGDKEPGYLKAFDNYYSEYDIFKHFDATMNPTLAGKPIVFIIQACRGKKPAKKVNVGEKKTSPQLDYGEEWEHYYIPTDADRLVFHSSYPGKASVRDPKDGSWFIQTLCRKINECALTHDLETIFRLVRRAVALHDDEEEEDWKQMPVVTSTTLREINLAPTPRRETAQPLPDSPFTFNVADDLSKRRSSDQLVEKEKEHVYLRGPRETPECRIQPEPVSPLVLRSETDDPRRLSSSQLLAEQLEEQASLSSQKQTPRRETAEPQPAPSLAFGEVDDRHRYPLSHQIAQNVEEFIYLGTVADANAALESGNASPVLMKLHHLPCCCFVEYFEYLRNCLEVFSQHNTEDQIAKFLLKMANKTEPGQEFNLQRFVCIQSMWEHLEVNKHRFPPEGFSFLHRMYVPLNNDEEA